MIAKLRIPNEAPASMVTFSEALVGELLEIVAVTPEPLKLTEDAPSKFTPETATLAIVPGEPAPGLRL